MDVDMDAKATPTEWAEFKKIITGKIAELRALMDELALIGGADGFPILVQLELACEYLEKLLEALPQ
jgi:hypothetical protein